MANYQSFKSIMQTLNPMYQTFMSRSAFEIKDEVQRHLYQIEGYVRQSVGQISQAQAQARGVFVTPVPVNETIQSGMRFTIDSVSNSILPSKGGILEDDGRRQSIVSTAVNSMLIGEGIRQYRERTFSSMVSDAQQPTGQSSGNEASSISTKTIRVDNRDAIDADSLYMWELAPTHVIFDICDDYHGRVYKGSDVPKPLHLGCNCRLRLLQGKDTGGRNASKVENNTQQNGSRLDAVATALSSENTTWQTIQRVIGYSNMAMDAYQRVQATTQQQTHSDDFMNRGVRTAAQEFSRFMVNPSAYFLDKAAIGLVTDIKGATINHAFNELKKEILVRGSFSQEMASTIDANGGRAFNRYVNASAERKQAYTQYNALSNIYNKYNSTTSLEEGIDLLRSSTDVLDAFNVDAKYFRRTVNSNLLDMTSTQAMMLEGGIRGTMRSALILF